jgi:hypothetical protein
MSPLTITQSVIALVLQLTATVIWMRLFGRIRPWNWWCCFLGLILVMTHRFGELLGYYAYGHFTAIPISMVFVFATYMAKRAVSVDEQRIERLRALEQHRIELETQVEEQKGAATALAIILNDFKSRIEFYEKQATDHALPKYEAPPEEAFESPEI